MASLEDYPAVHDAYQKYVEREPSAPRDATQLSRWAKRFLQVNLAYADVNKYLRLKQGKPAEAPRAAPPQSRSYNRLPRLPSKKSTLPQTRSRPQSVINSKPPVTHAKSHSNSVFNAPTRDRGLTAPSRSNTQPALLSRSRSPPIEKETQEVEERPTMASNIKGLDPDSPVSVELWVYRIGYGDHVEGIKASIPNLRWLVGKNEDEVKDICAQIGMGPVFRRKFIQQVQLVQDLYSSSPPDEEKDPTSPRIPTADTGPVNVEFKRDEDDSATLAAQQQPLQKRKSIQMNQAEDQALSKFRATIRSTAQTIKTMQANLPDIAHQARALRLEIEEEFDNYVREVTRCKLNLVNHVNVAESETSKRCSDKIRDLQQAGARLLKTKKVIESRLAEAVDDEQRRERSAFVVSEVAEVLGNVPKVDRQYRLVMKKPEMSLTELLGEFGLIVREVRFGDESVASPEAEV